MTQSLSLVLKRMDNIHIVTHEDAKMLSKLKRCMRKYFLAGEDEDNGEDNVFICCLNVTREEVRDFCKVIPLFKSFDEWSLGTTMWGTFSYKKIGTISDSTLEEYLKETERVGGTVWLFLNYKDMHSFAKNTTLSMRGAILGKTLNL